MELHQLRYFVAVADEENFTRASEICLVAQPSLSQQIIKLEKELGQPLFERLGRRVRLTDAGRLLYDRANGILSAVDNVKNEITDSTADGNGRVAVGAIVTIAPYVLPPLLKMLGRRFPKAEVVVHENLTAHVVEECLRGELDIGLVALPIEHEQLHVETLFEDELLLATPSGHPLAKRRRVTMQDVMKEPFILLDPIHCLGEQVVAFCDQQDCKPHVVCRSSQILTVQELVGLGHGVSLIPATAADGDRSKKRHYRSLTGTRPTRTLAMIWHQKRYQNQLVRCFAEQVREHAAELKS